MSFSRMGSKVPSPAKEQVNMTYSGGSAFVDLSLQKVIYFAASKGELQLSADGEEAMDLLGKVTPN